MIAILFPEGDYTAADAALKIQALASDHDNRTFLVPRHYQRDGNAIARELGKCKVALFVASDTSILAGTVAEDMSILVQAGAVIHAIVPSEFHFSGIVPESQLRVYFHDRDSPENLIAEARKSVSNFLRTKRKVVRDDELIMGLLGLGLFVLLVGTMVNVKK